MSRPPDAVPAPHIDRPRSNVSRREAPAPVNSEGYRLAQCEFCRGPILWAREMDNPKARTPEGVAGKLVPIDPEPTTDQRAVLALSPPSGKHPQPRVGTMRTGQAAGYRAAGGQTYLQHVKSCTKADDMRRGVVKRHTKR